jgi:hypothetical protein
VIGTTVPIVAIIAGAGVLSFGVYFSQFLSLFGVGYSPVLLGVTFLGTTAAICVAFFVLRRRHSPVLDNIGATVDSADDEAANG